MTYSPRNLLVTGGAGFIGANYVRRLLRKHTGGTIVNLDLLTYAACPENLGDVEGEEGYHFVTGDICDTELVERLLATHDIDTIVHFAAESHVDRSISGPSAFIQTNLIGTFTLLEASRRRWKERFGMAADACRFHHISTDEVYGSLGADDPAFSEKTPYSPNSPYSASKAGSDHLVRAYGHTYGLPVTTSNCSNNYGPFQHREKFIPTVIHACLDGRSIPVYGDGSNVRDWLYVEDHCRAIDLVVSRGTPGETYNVGGDNEWTNLEICRLICRLMDERRTGGAPHDRLITFVTDRPGHDWRYAVDTRHIRQALGWSAIESFETGIRKTIDWYLERAGVPTPDALPVAG